jgi:hypothetical protein
VKALLLRTMSKCTSNKWGATGNACYCSYTYWYFRLDSTLLGYDASSVGNRTPTVQHNVLHLSFKIDRSSKDRLSWKLRAACYLEISGSNYPFTRRHEPEQRNPPLQRWEKPSISQLTAEFCVGTVWQLAFVPTCLYVLHTIMENKSLKIINPLTPEVNPSAQRCLTRIFTGDFDSWNVHFVNICVKNQQIHQLFIQFINYVW